MPLKGHTRCIHGLAFSATAQQLARASQDGMVRIWQMDAVERLRSEQDDKKAGEDVAEKQVAKVLDAHKECVASQKPAVYTVAFSPKKALLASGGEDRGIHLWEQSVDVWGQRGEPLIGHTGGINAFAFHPEGNQLVSASGDHTLKEWNLTNKVCCRTLEGHTKSALSVQYSPGGALIASGSADKTIKLWPLAGTGASVTLTGHTGHVETLLFTDAETLVSGGQDKSVRIWNIVPAKDGQTVDWSLQRMLPPPNELYLGNVLLNKVVGLSNENKGLVAQHNHVDQDLPEVEEVKEVEEKRTVDLAAVRLGDTSWRGYFGKKLWEQYLGPVGIAPAVPEHIIALLNQPCKLWPGKLVYETHLLTLIPATVKGKPLTLNSFRALIKKPQGGKRRVKAYKNYDDYTKVQACLGEASLVRSR